MSSYYDTMQVCKKWGHKVTDCYNEFPAHRQDFCEKCGSSTIHTCDKCGTNIRGYYFVEGVVGGGGAEVALHCHKCGASYPWKWRLFTKRMLIAMVSPIKYLIDAIVGIFQKIK